MYRCVAVHVSTDISHVVVNGGWAYLEDGGNLLLYFAFG